VFAGDTVTFNISAIDSQYFDNGVPQTVTIEAIGSAFGTGFTNANAGCVIPPCATLVPNSPSVANPNQVSQGQLNAQTVFNWVTGDQHVLGLNTNCQPNFRTYNFVIKSSDNYCPANALTTQTISIVVRRLLSSYGSSIGDMQFSITPNPANDDLRVNFNEVLLVKHVRIMDQTGRVVDAQSPNQLISDYQLNMAHLPSGIYSLQIITTDAQFNRKFVKVKQ
jgi:hypothetical protein